MLMRHWMNGKMEFDNYSSHVLVLGKILESFEVKRVLEFGMGKFSTPFLAERSEHVVSVEQGSREWYEKLKGEIKSPNWEGIFQVDPRVIFERFDSERQGFDLVFSDGIAETRCLVANLAMERGVRFVVLHDAEKVWYYRWNLLNISAEYSRFDFRHLKGANKVTTILTKGNQQIIERWDIAEHERVLQAYSSPGQPIFHIQYPRPKGEAEKASDVLRHGGD